jgi:hypothetical protein
MAPKLTPYVGGHLRPIGYPRSEAAGTEHVGDQSESAADPGFQLAMSLIDPTRTGTGSTEDPRAAQVAGRHNWAASHEGECPVECDDSGHE